MGCLPSKLGLTSSSSSVPSVKGLGDDINEQIDSMPGLTARDFTSSPSKGKRRRDGDGSAAKRGSPPRHTLRSSNGLSLGGTQPTVKKTPIRDASSLRRRPGHKGNQTPKDNQAQFGTSMGIELQSPTRRVYYTKQRSPSSMSSNSSDSAPVVSGVALDITPGSARRAMRRPIPPSVPPPPPPTNARKGSKKQPNAGADAFNLFAPSPPPYDPPSSTAALSLEALLALPSTMSNGYIPSSSAALSSSSSAGASVAPVATNTAAPVAAPIVAPAPTMVATSTPAAAPITPPSVTIREPPAIDNSSSSYESTDESIPEAPPMDIPPPPPLETGFPDLTDAKIAATPSRKLKRFHWQKIAPSSSASDTLWASLAADQSSLSFDRDVFEQKFAAERKIDKEAEAAERERLAAELAASGNKKVSIIEGKRAYNVDISLARFRMSHRAIRDALVMMDADILTEERLSILAKIIPTDEEIAAIGQYAGDFASLGNVEQFFAIIGGLPIAAEAGDAATPPLPLGPGVHRRMQSMVFRSQFAHAADVVERWLGYVEEACKELRSSEHLRTVLLVVLKMGNLLNGGTHDGEASGFRLSALGKLRGTRTVDNKSTLLHVLIEYIEKEIPAAMNFADQLSHVHHAAKVESAFVGKEIKQMQQKVSGLKLELDALNRSRVRGSTQYVGLSGEVAIGNGTIGSAYNDTMQQFLVSAIPRSSMIGKRLATVTEVTNRLASYFGESACGWEEFFKHFDHFIVSFAQARGEIHAERAREAEAEKRKHRASLSATTKANKSRMSLSSGNVSMDTSRDKENMTPSRNSLAKTGSGFLSPLSNSMTKSPSSSVRRSGSKRGGSGKKPSLPSPGERMTASPSRNASSAVLRSPLRAINSSSSGAMAMVSSSSMAGLQSPQKKLRMDQSSGVSKSPASLHHASIVAQFDPFSPARQSARV